MPVEDPGDDRVGVVHGKPADQVDGVVVGADFRLRAAQRHGQLGDRAAFPPQDQAGVRVGVVAAGGDVHLLQQGAQQLLAVLIGGGGRVLHLAQVVAQGQDRVPLGRGKGRRPGGLAAGELGFGVGELLQGGVPFGFQAAGDQPVLGVDRAVAALGLDGLVAGLLDLAAVLVQRRVVAVLELLGGVQAGLQRGRLEGGEECLGDGGVDGLPAGVHVPGPRPLTSSADPWQ